MIKDLITLANHLDSKGLTKEADYLDNIIKSAASQTFKSALSQCDEKCKECETKDQFEECLKECEIKLFFAGKEPYLSHNSSDELMGCEDLKADYKNLHRCLEEYCAIG